MAKKIIIPIVSAIMVLFIASLCIFAHGATDAVFKDLITPKSEPEKPLSLGDNAKINDFYGLIGAKPAKINDWSNSQNSKLLVVFSIEPDGESLESWASNGYEILIYKGNDTEYFVAGYSDYLNASSFIDIRFAANDATRAKLMLDAASLLQGKSELYPEKCPERLMIFEDDISTVYAYEDEIYSLWREGIAVEVLTNSEVQAPLKGATIVFPTGEKWYSKTLEIHGELYDKRMNNSKEKVPCASSNASYVLLRAGTIYRLYEGQNTTDIADDVIKSENIETAIVGGIAKVENAFGTESRLAKVKIELYLISGTENRLMGNCITDSSGFYHIQIPKIYANGFDEFYLVIYMPTGYTKVSQTITGNFIFEHMKSSVNIDIGAIKNEN